MRPAFRQSLETQALVRVLSDQTHGDLFSYEELTQAAGVDVQHANCLKSARHIVQREQGVVFLVVTGRGLVRANDEQIVDSGAQDITRLRNTARRAIKKASCVKSFAALPHSKQVQHNLQLSSAGLMYHLTTTKAQNKIESRVSDSLQALSVVETINAIRSES